MKATVLYFTPDKSEAFVWPEDQNTGLVVLRKSEFPEVWPRLQIGVRMDFRRRHNNSLQLVAYG